MESATADDIEMRHLLARTLPDVVIVVGFGDLKVYGFHFRKIGSLAFHRDIKRVRQFMPLWMEAQSLRWVCFNITTS